MDKGKEEILKDWRIVLNAIIRADSGEIKVTYIRESEVDKSKKDLVGTDKDRVVGIFVDMMLKFPEPLAQEFTEEEKKAVKKAAEDKKEKGKK